MSIAKTFTGLLFVSTALTIPGVAFAQGTGGAPNTGAEGSAATQAEDPDVLADQVVGMDGQPQEQAVEQPDISIPGGEIVVTGRRNRDISRGSTQIVSVLSAEQIARTGEGDIAGALSRVTGLSTAGNGLVYVRGLGDRYSLALLNGLPLPSPQPLSRVVPLDIFPTNIIASSLVQKTYSANFPGEFGGGVINLTTRAVPEESFLTIGGGISGDSQTTGFDGIAYYGSDLDPLGFDDGTRDVPPALRDFFASGNRLSDLDVDQQAIAKQLGDPNLVLTQRIGNLPLNFSGNITGGTSVDVGADGADRVGRARAERKRKRSTCRRRNETSGGTRRHPPRAERRRRDVGGAPRRGRGRVGRRRRGAPRVASFIGGVRGGGLRDDRHHGRRNDAASVQRHAEPAVRQVPPRRDALLAHAGRRVPVQ